jgi:hypothetical protein
MARLPFRPEYVDPILDGSKTTTMRKTKPRCEPGQDIEATVGRGVSGRTFATLHIEGIEKVDTEALGTADALADGYPSVEALLRELRRFYPNERYLWRLRWTLA